MMKRRRIFIGSSVEGLGLAEAFAEHFEHNNDWEAITWADTDFSLGRATLDSLESLLSEYEYGVFIMTPDDDVQKRTKKSKQPRDNVLFELGMFLGRNKGRNRTFMVTPKNIEMELPSDLSGITSANFHYPPPTDRGECKRAMAPAARNIKKQLQLFETEEEEAAVRKIRSITHYTKERLVSISDERKKIQIVTESLQDILENHAVATRQSVNDTLSDVLLWAGSLLDFFDVEQLSENQTTQFEEVWVYAPQPLELSKGNQLLRDRVSENLKEGVKYKYFVEDLNGLHRIINFIEEIESESNYSLKHNVSIVILNEHAFFTYYTFHFLSQNDYVVLQSIIREDRNDLATKLPVDHAKRIYLLVNKYLKKCVNYTSKDIEVFELK